MQSLHSYGIHVYLYYEIWENIITLLVKSVSYIHLYCRDKKRMAIHMCAIVDCLLARRTLSDYMTNMRYEQVCAERADQKVAFMRAYHDGYSRHVDIHYLHSLRRVPKFVQWL